MPFCQNCGREAQSGSFCTACGQRFANRSPKFPINPYIVAGLIVIIFLALAIGLNITRPFLAVNDDDNAVYGLGAVNQARFGVFAMKFGITTGYFDSLGDVGRSFYTHHPQWFILPITLSYDLFGISEAATRLPGIIFSALSVLALYFTVLIFYRDQKKALLSAAAYAILPGLLFYSASLSEKVFTLAFSNFVFLAFFLLQRYQSKYLKPLLLFVVFYGGLQGWHFYFAVAGLWLYSLLNKDSKHRKFLLAAVPAVSILSFGFNFLHFYLLNGPDFFADLMSQFTLRSARIPPGTYVERYSFWLRTNFTLPTVIVASFFLIYAWIMLISKKQFGLLLLFAVQPLLVIAIFQQWTMHSFGPIYWAQFVALSMGLALDKLLQLKDKRLLVVGIIVTALFIGSSISDFRIFSGSRILGEKDIRLLKDISEQAPEAKVALGEQFTLDFTYSSIVQWYLKRPLTGWEKGEADLVLAYNPEFGPPFQQELQKMLDSGYYKLSAPAGYYWLLEHK